MDKIDEAQPFVSIIVPNYNHSKYLVQRIDSILDQTYQNFELILLDDCSLDDSRDILSSYSDDRRVSHVVFNEQNGGTPFKQWKKGISLSSGSWVWIAESDDWAEKDFLERMIRQAQIHPDCGLISSVPRYVDDEGNNWSADVDGSATYYVGKEFIRRELLYGNKFVNVSALIFKRYLFESVDFEKFIDFHLCGDWMFYVLMARQTNVLEYREVISNYRIHVGNTSGWAESAGLTFLEGVYILDEILRNQTINTSDYARYWGKKWANYSRRYEFSIDVEKKITASFITHHKAVVMYFIIYKLWYLLKLGAKKD